MDRLTSIDASFLSNETATSHMHIGAVMIFEGAPPAYEDLIAHIDSRLHLVPRYRQKLATPPAETGRPFWVDDPHFNITYHVRHASLPAPGDEDQLRRRVARVFSQRLDRSKPLWELWLIEGLERKRFALISKTHHALVDGISGVDIATVLFDFSADDRAADIGARVASAAGAVRAPSSPPAASRAWRRRRCGSPGGWRPRSSGR